MLQKTRGRPIDTNKVITNVIHYPTLKTVLAVEDAIRDSKDYLTKTEIRRRLEKKIMMQTLNIILAYLENSGKILITKKGVIWIRNENPRFLKLLKTDKGVRL